ncbi:MAG TPA: heme ABC exporter ATP-binding protein CcmA [Gemmataceae bacterium]|nr:heme ABC exporter ATP-binding protein CcmA [Gemmataceae bacterium]
MPVRSVTIGQNRCAIAAASPDDADVDAASFALEARGLGYVRGRQPVFRGVDLAVREGEIVLLAGANGAGKTTLLQCLAGALVPTAGQVSWFGSSARSPAARRLIGYLGHECGLYLTLTARENLLFAGRMCGLSRVTARADELLSVIGLCCFAGQQAGRLSRGMRQRLAIARAVVHDPPIVLLDEPFTSLDDGGRDWLIQFLRSLRARQRSILLVAHGDELSRNLADRLVCLQAGRIGNIEMRTKGA